MFDGVNDYVAIPNEANFDLTGAMTVACWIKVDVFDAAYQAIVTKGNTAWRLAREGTTNFVQFSCTGLSQTKVVSTIKRQRRTMASRRRRLHGQPAAESTSTACCNNSVTSTGSISTNNQPVRDRPQ